MSWARLLISLFCIGPLGCASMPLFPNVPVYVGQGHSLGQFADDADRCRQFATDYLGTEHPKVEIRRAAMNGLIGALIGAGIGAALGSVVGGLFVSLIGASVGATGGAFGIGQGRRTADVLQARYDLAYGVCMDHAGHRVKDAVP